VNRGFKDYRVFRVRSGHKVRMVLPDLPDLPEIPALPVLTARKE
jgi:hypothetical protein